MISAHTARGGIHWSMTIDGLSLGFEGGCRQLLEGRQIGCIIHNQIPMPMLFPENHFGLKGI